MSSAADTKPAPEEEPPARKKFTFPSALTILAVVTLAVWALAFLIPPGAYDRDEEGPRSRARTTGSTPTRVSWTA